MFDSMPLLFKLYNLNQTLNTLNKFFERCELLIEVYCQYLFRENLKLNVKSLHLFR